MTCIVKPYAACLLALLPLHVLSAEAPLRPTRFQAGIETYRETYREYRHGQRLMQQQGALVSATAGLSHDFAPNHTVRLNARYAQGKSDYTGTALDDEGTPAYGSVTYRNAPRKTYEIQTAYRYRRALGERTALELESGLGYRVLKDLPRKLNEHDYDRENRILYACAAAGVRIRLPNAWALTPTAAYHHLLHGRQRSHNRHFDLTLTQKKGKGIEAALPLSKQFANQSELIIGPFYRGWKVSDSESGSIAHHSGSLTVLEPQNHTHEAGLRLEYRF